ncbi:hypothetical protein CMV_014070 [Castanea mollissima]|uniref:Uncharacterized protein n=1 Tax=Castanea mollissima TaxID=60419 RepID=A0A8J4QWR5_9ROSI|nr:hypothetical protein CMV_014070 [Castanea mollissima]
MQGSSIHGVNSVISSTRMDNSFVVLPKQKPQQQPQGIPPCPHAGAGAVQLDISLPGRQCKNHLLPQFRPRLSNLYVLNALVLSDKLDKEVEDVNRDIEAYEACLYSALGGRGTRCS